MSAAVAADSWVFAARFGDLKEDHGIRVQLPGGGRKDAVALFLHRGELFALEDRCCHKDKSIHDGDIEDLGLCIVGVNGAQGTGGVCVQCPRHQRKFAGGLYFNLQTGEARTPGHSRSFDKMDRHRVRVHAVKVERGDVFVSARPHRRSRAAREIVIDDEEPRLAASRPCVVTQLCNRLAGLRGNTVVVSEDEDDAEPATVPDVKRRRAESDSDTEASGRWMQLVLDDVQKVSRDSFIFVLQHPAGTSLPGMPGSPIWHVALQATIGGKVIEREYTPVSNWAEWCEGRRLRLLIKIYPDGLMTQHLAQLPVGSELAVSPPQVTLSVPELLPPAAGPAAEPPHVVLIAAGTGIVPMVQVLDAVLTRDGPFRTVSLLYVTRAPDDLLCLTEVRRAAELSDRLRVLLAFSSGVTALEEWPSAPVLDRRLDATALDLQLARLPRGEVVRVIISGPQGFFESMRDSFPARIQEAAVFVNLDD